MSNVEGKTKYLGKENLSTVQLAPINLLEVSNLSKMERRLAMKVLAKLSDSSVKTDSKRAEAISAVQEESLIKIRRPLVNRINKALQPINDQTYFDRIPIKDIDEVLRKYGLLLLQEDGTPWSGFLFGGEDKTERIKIEVGFLSTKKDGIYTPIKNSFLILTYYKLESGRFEVVVYLS